MENPIGEIKMMADVNHDNIVKCYGGRCTDDGTIKGYFAYYSGS
jgi:hypothetical protein